MVTFYGGPMDGETINEKMDQRARRLIVPQLFFTEIFAPIVYLPLVYEWCDTDDSLFYVGWWRPCLGGTDLLTGEFVPYPPEFTDEIMGQIREKYGAELEELPA